MSCHDCVSAPLSGWGFKGENYGKGRWTQTQLHTGGNDKGEQKASFNLAKAECKKNQGRQNGDKKQSNNQNSKAK